MASRTGRPAAFPGRVQFKKKLSTMRSMQRRMGGGPPVPSDMEQRVLGLVGKHPRTTTDATADPEVMPPVRPQARPQRPEDGGVGQESADDPTTSGAEELRLSPVNPLGLFSTDESADFEELVSPHSRTHSTSRPSIGPPVIPASPLEVLAPSTSPQGTPVVPRTAPTPQRSCGRGRSVPLARHDSGKTVQLSRRTVDIGDQLFEALGGISQHLATMTEYMPRMGVPECDSQEHCCHSPPSGPRVQHSLGSAPPLRTTDESKDQDPASASENAAPLALLAPVPIHPKHPPSSPPNEAPPEELFSQAPWSEEGKGWRWGEREGGKKVKCMCTCAGDGCVISPSGCMQFVAMYGGWGPPSCFAFVFCVAGHVEHVIDVNGGKSGMWGLDVIGCDTYDFRPMLALYLCY
uniref:uncharacterized protein isoform X1 n=1 Tax=Pristiophorus japonicus TaxID=55135 RepID=UPI00398EA010